MKIEQRQKLLFIGDSITEDGRFNDPAGLGLRNPLGRMLMAITWLEYMGFRRDMDFTQI